MRGSSGNGNPPKRYHLDRTDFYIACRANVEARYPLVRQIGLFDQIEAGVQLFPPTENAERLEGMTWVLVTQASINVPEVDVFFTFDDRLVTLQAAHAGEGTALG